MRKHKHREPLRNEFLSVTHFRAGLRPFVGDGAAPTVKLSADEDSFLPRPSVVDVLGSVVSVAILPPSFSHRSSIFFFRRFLATGSAIVVSSLLFHGASPIL